MLKTTLFTMVAKYATVVFVIRIFLSVRLRIIVILSCMVNCKIVKLSNSKISVWFMVTFA